MIFQSVTACVTSGRPLHFLNSTLFWNSDQPTPPMPTPILFSAAGRQKLKPALTRIRIGAVENIAALQRLRILDKSILTFHVCLEHRVFSVHILF